MTKSREDFLLDFFFSPDHHTPMNIKETVTKAVSDLDRGTFTFLYMDDKTGKNKRRAVQFLRPAKEMKEVYESKGKGSWTTLADTSAHGALLTKNDKEYLRAYPTVEDSSGYSDISKVFSLEKITGLAPLTIKETNGDVIEMAREGQFDVVVQGCNCFNTMGSGLAAQVRVKCPNAYKADLASQSGDKNKLGTYTLGMEKENYVMINGYTQYGFGRMSTNPDGGPVMEAPADYDAIRSVL